MKMKYLKTHWYGTLWKIKARGHTANEFVIANIGSRIWQHPLTGSRIYIRTASLTLRRGPAATCTFNATAEAREGVERKEDDGSQY